MSSSVLKWPDRAEVHRAICEWAERVARSRPGVLRIGYFGSYARGSWGVGSDLDVLVIVETCDEPFERRRVGWNAEDLPVPVDLLIYTAAEWERLRASVGFARTVEREAVWVFSPSPPRSPVCPEPQ